MRMDKSVYRYIERELYRYDKYKKDLRLERERILDASPNPPDGMPRGNAASNSTESKCLKLMDSTVILTMERIIQSIDTAFKRLKPMHREVFELYYIRGRKDVYCMCDELHISYESFSRYKSEIVFSVGIELGIPDLAKS